MERVNLLGRFSALLPDPFDKAYNQGLLDAGLILSSTLAITLIGPK